MSVVFALLVLAAPASAAETRYSLANGCYRAVGVPGSQDAATTIGVTWYATRWIRFQANAVHERLRGAVSEPMPPARMWTRLIRFQVVM